MRGEGRGLVLLLGSPLLMEQSFREGRTGRRTHQMIPLWGQARGSSPGLPTWLEFGSRSRSKGSFEPQGDSPFPRIYHAAALAPPAPTCWVCALSQAPSQGAQARESSIQREQDHVSMH